ncbi:hypothetical protein L6272_04450, partial [Microgenomates group bacterium]|nr:hypothetical protein [Microgenomates group bacterium]
PEPDIPPIVLTEAYVENLRKQLPKLPEMLVQELVKDFHLNISTEQLLVKDASKLAYFKKYLSEIDPVVLANLIVNKKIDLAKPPPQKTVTRAVDSKIISQVIQKNAGAVAKYKAGKTTVIGFLVGQVMRLSNGKVDPVQAKQMLESNLRGPTSQD